MVAATPTLRIATKTASAVPQSPQQANRASPASGWSSPQCQRVIMGGGADHTGGWLAPLSRCVRPGISVSEGRCHLSKAIADFIFFFLLKMRSVLLLLPSTVLDLFPLPPWT